MLCSVCDTAYTYATCGVFRQDKFVILAGHCQVCCMLYTRLHRATRIYSIEKFNIEKKSRPFNFACMYRHLVFIAAKFRYYIRILYKFFWKINSFAKIDEIASQEVPKFTPLRYFLFGKSHQGKKNNLLPYPSEKDSIDSNHPPLLVRHLR